ncbi:MAG TPA: LOG family protein [Acidimicrobiales bacterium]|nr:LOG family protein [Acidimicrobiales bacterium]
MAERIAPDQPEVGRNQAAAAAAGGNVSDGLAADRAAAERSPAGRSASDRTTGSPELDQRLEDLLDAIGVNANRDQLRELLVSVARLAQGHPDRLDLKIANAALREMREGFEVFAPYRKVRKITMFGSARTAPTDPLYAQARDLASRLAERGWSTVTGAGPGIMAAGLEGAGPEHAFGINIRLPFEQEPNQFISSDPKLVSMKYFFTRKLLLVKESDGYAVLPGGFGTLDEAFELLTLLQTGKAQPAPVVLLEVPHGSYWQAWEGFVVGEVAARGLIDRDDAGLYLITDDVMEAAGEILAFYRNYHSARWVGDRLVIRVLAQPTDAEVGALNERFADICLQGGIEALPGPLPAEAREVDHPELPRLALRFDPAAYPKLRLLINAVNALPSAPPRLPDLPVPACQLAATL